MHRITLLRHGRSLADDEGKFEGRYDAPLTQTGIAQVRRVADRLSKDADRAYDLAICSPLRRARQTASIVADACGCELVEDPVWLELDNGKLAGLPFAEGRALFPPSSLSGAFTRVGGTGESVAEFQARALSAVQSLTCRPEGSYLVVAHGGIINAALRVVLGMPVPDGVQSGPTFRFHDTSFVDLTYCEDDHRWAVSGFYT